LWKGSSQIGENTSLSISLSRFLFLAICERQEQGEVKKTR
jgi:hypothetical protein